MFRKIVQQAFDDMFEHFGQAIICRTKSGGTRLIAVIKEPENAYDFGDLQIVDQVAEVTVKSAELTPKIGDHIIANSRKYKIYTTPLLDASNYVWKFFAVLVGNE